MSRYSLAVVLVVFGWVLNGPAEERPEQPKKPVRMPVIDCVVEYAHGNFGSHGSVSSEDTITLDLNAIDKIRLNFRSEKSDRSYVPHKPFRVQYAGDPYLPLYFDMRLVSSGTHPRVTINISGLNGAWLKTACDEQPHSPALPCGAPTNRYEITILSETEGDFPGIAILNGTATE
jgi:hypothetical protein